MIRSNRSDVKKVFIIAALYFMEVSTTIDKPMFETLLLLVPAEKQNSVLRFRFDIDKKLSLYSEIVLRSVLCQRLHVDNHRIVFKTGEHGKPYLANNPVFFNLSHTRNAIAIAVSDAPVGIDIERMNGCCFQVAEHFFTANEQNYIFSVPEERGERFYEIWTKKEAYMKYCGKGLSVPLHSFDVIQNKALPVLHTVCMNGYVISICTNAQPSCFPLTVFSESDLHSTLQTHHMKRCT